MKWMKWLLVLAVGLGVALGTVGCDDDDDNGSSNSLVGTWRATHFNGQEIPAGTVSVTTNFRSDGTLIGSMVLGQEVESLNGTWSTSGGILTTTIDGETESIPYSVSGNTLTLTDPEEGVITLRRQ